MDGLATALAPSIGLLLIAGLCTTTAPMSARGTMPPRNSVYGLRTRSTMRSAAAWEAGHRAAAPYFATTAATGGGSAVIVVTAGVLRAPEGTVLMLVGAAHVATMTVLMLGTRRASRAAR